MTANTRRDFLKQGGALSLFALAQALGVKTAFGAPGTTNRNVVFVELFGGNDGFNTLVPFAVNGGAYYDSRKKLAVAESKLLKVGNKPVGFHPSLQELHARFLAGKVAVIQGVGYPNPNFSHSFSQRIWHSGLPANPSSQGWLARYLSLYPKPSFPNATEIGDALSVLYSGGSFEIPAIGVIEAYTFPSDGHYGGDLNNRRQAYEKILAGAATQSGLVNQIGATGEQLLDLIDRLETVPPMTFSPLYTLNDLSVQLQIVTRLMNANLGLRFFRTQLGNFDTHALQNQGKFHENLLGVLSQSLEAFLQDLTALGLASNTIVVVFSEFGRTLAENASFGTDHGTVNNVLVLGDSVEGGFVNDHPSLHPSQLDVTGQPIYTVDFRDVFGTILKRWLGEPPANMPTIFPGYSPVDLEFLP